MGLSTTPSGWTAAPHGGVWSLVSGGVFLWGQALSAPRTVGAGKFLRIAIGAEVITVT